MITAGSFSKVDPGHHFTVESFPHFWLGWLWSVLAFDFLEDNLCDVTSRHSVTAYHGGRYLVESITLVEVVIKNMRVLKRHDKFIPSEVARTKRFLKKKISLFTKCAISVGPRHTHTADSLPILCWCSLGRVPHVAASSSSRTGTQHSACCDLTHTPCEPNSVNLPSVFASLRKWLCPACRHTHTHR